MRIGEDIRFAAQIVARCFAEPGKDVRVQHLEALLRECQAGGQGDDVGLHLRVERMKRPPRSLGHGAAGAPSISHPDPMLMLR